MRRHLAFSCLLILSVLVLDGCAQTAPVQQPEDTVTPEPRASPTLAATPTLPAPPTALPGSLVLPIDTLGTSIPWLPLTAGTRPGTYSFWFNVRIPPFNNVLVRQAFAAAVDREVLTEMARKYGKPSATPATSLTPAETLGRDLYNEVGIPYNPTRAKELLAQAGYTDPSKLPTFTLMTSVTGEPAPGAHQRIAEEMIRMWRETLGVTGTLAVLPWETHIERIRTNPPEIFRLGWVADINDPDNFLRVQFHTGSEYNSGGFSDAEFDRLVDAAAESSDPAKRQQLYIEAERILCETQAAIIPIYHYR